MKTALALIAVLATLVAARAKPLECVLWPKACQAPVAAPANPAPPLSQPAPIQAAPPVTVTAQAKPKPTARLKAKAKPKATKPRRLRSSAPSAPPRKQVADDGPNLPWPCWQVRLNAWGKSEAALRAEGRARGVNLTPKQERQAKACLGR